MFRAVGIRRRSSRHGRRITPLALTRSVGSTSGSALAGGTIVRAGAGVTITVTASIVAQLMIESIKNGNGQPMPATSIGDVNASTEGLGVRPFNARSLVLSVLLGLPDPRLGRPAAFRLGELFGIAPGAMRTAMS